MQCTSVPFPGTLTLIRLFAVCLTANNSASSLSTKNSALCRGNHSGFIQHSTDISTGRNYIKVRDAVP